MDVVAVIVTHNDEDEIAGCLDAVGRQTLQPTRVVVFDNASSDRTVQRAREHLPKISTLEVIRSPENIGLSAALNTVANDNGTADAIWTMNADTRPDPNYLAQLATALAADERIGSAQGVLSKPTGEIDSAGHHAHTPGVFVNRTDVPASTTPVFGVTGASALHRVTMLDGIRIDASGRWDPEIFAYFDDLDLDWRARVAGWTAVVVPAACATHIRHGDRWRTGPLVAALSCKNWLRLVAGRLSDDAWSAWRWQIFALQALRILRLMLSHPGRTAEVVRDALRVRSHRRRHQRWRQSNHDQLLAVEQEWFETVSFRWHVQRMTRALGQRIGRPLAWSTSASGSATGSDTEHSVGPAAST